MIQFKYQPTLRDYQLLNRRVLVRQFSKLFWFAGALLAIFLILPFLPLTSRSGHTVVQIYVSGLALLILPAIIALAFVSTYFAAKRRWRDASEIRSERLFEIDEKGMRVTGDKFSGFMEWSHFRSVDFSYGLVFIRTAQNQFHFFPERLVDDRTMLRNLLQKPARETQSKRLFLGMPVPLAIGLCIVVVLLALFFIPSGHK
jgi:hypothetical protein